MPIYAIPKPHSTNLRLITDQSYGKYSLNSMIMHEKVTGFPLDNMTHFVEMLMDLERWELQVEKVVWRSDIAEAYQILPMHPRWQIKQVNWVDDEYFIDRCNSFGRSGASGIFISFNSLLDCAGNKMNLLPEQLCRWLLWLWPKRQLPLLWTIWETPP